MRKKFDFLNHPRIHYIVGFRPYEEKPREEIKQEIKIKSNFRNIDLTTNNNIRKYPLEQELVIYFMQVPTSEVKIGIVRDHLSLKKRLQSVQTGNHQEIKIIRTLMATLSDELWLHKHYESKGLHIRGEWFNFDEEMLIIIPQIERERERKEEELKKKLIF